MKVLNKKGRIIDLNKDLFDIMMQEGKIGEGKDFTEYDEKKDLEVETPIFLFKKKTGIEEIDNKPITIIPGPFVEEFNNFPEPIEEVKGNKIVNWFQNIFIK